MVNNTMSDLDMKILSHFRRDTLCGGCSGPVERDRVHTCWKCDMKAHVRTQLDWVDTASMNMAIKLGIKRPPPPARQLPPPASKSKKKTSRKPTRKKTTKKKGPKKTKLMGQ